MDFTEVLREETATRYDSLDLGTLSEGALQEIEFVKDATRIDEATEIEPVAQAFARAELHPHGQKGLGIYGANTIKALGHQLGEKTLAALTPEQEEGALRAVMAALASGYAMFMSLEASNSFSFQPGADLSQIWAVAVVNFRGNGIGAHGFSSSVSGRLEDRAQEAFIAELVRSGVIKRRKRRIGLVGRYYGQAGALMRLAQTDFSLPQQTEAFVGVANEWPYEDYASA